MEDIQRRATRRMRWLLIGLVGFVTLGGATGFVVMAAHTRENVFSSARDVLAFLLFVLGSVALMAAALALGWWYTRRRGVPWVSPLLGADRFTRRRVMRALRHGTPPEDAEERLLTSQEARRLVALSPLAVGGFAIAGVGQVMLLLSDPDDGFTNAIRPMIALFFIGGAGYQYWYWRRARTYLAVHDVPVEKNTPGDA